MIRVFEIMVRTTLTSKRLMSKRLTLHNIRKAIVPQDNDSRLKFKSSAWRPTRVVGFAVLFHVSGSSNQGLVKALIKNYEY